MCAQGSFCVEKGRSSCLFNVHGATGSWQYRDEAIYVVVVGRLFHVVTCSLESKKRRNTISQSIKT